MSQNSNEKNTPSDGESAQNVPDEELDNYTWPPRMFEAGAAADGPVKAKCSKEKKITHQTDIKIQPTFLNEMTPEASMEVLKLAKRLTLCHSCGNLSLTN